MPFTFLSPDEFLCNNSKNHLYTSAQVRLLYLMLDVREIGPRTSWSNIHTTYVHMQQGRTQNQVNLKCQETQLCWFKPFVPCPTRKVNSL